MKKELIDVLATLNNAEFIELRMSLSIADNARHFLRKYSWDVKKFAREMDLTVPKAKRFLNGTLDYNFVHIAKFEKIVNDNRPQYELMEIKNESGEAELRMNKIEED